MPDVFLSYKREDRAAASRLLEGLRAAGLDLWWDADIPPDAPWEATIEGALADARVVLVCWSKAAVASDNVRSEARWAREQGKLFQAFLEPCTPPLFFGERQGVDLSGWSGDVADPRFGRLVTAIQKRLKGAELSPQDGVELDKMSETLPVFALAPAKDGKAKGRRQDFRTAGFVAAGLLVLALAALGAWLLRADLGSPPEGTVIAVVPFTAVGSGSQAQDFAESLTDALQNAVDANNMQTVSRADADLLKGAERDKLVRRLGVRLLLDGTVEDDGNQMQVNVRLEDPRRHVTLWTTQKDGPSSQPSVLQARVGALAIAVMNCSTAALRPKGGLADAEALGLFLKACGLFEDKVGAGDNPEPIYSFLNTFRQVVAKAPRFGPGHSALAKYLAYYRWFLPRDQLIPLTAEANTEAHKALAIDPKDPEAYVALYLLRPPQDLLGRQKLIDQALASDPSWLYAIIFKSAFLQQVGRMKEGLAFAQKAVAGNPLSGDITLDEPLAWTGQTEAAERELTRIRTLWPGPGLWSNRLVVYEAAEDWRQLDEALDDPDRPENVSDSDVAYLRTVSTAMRTRTRVAIARARAAILARALDGGSSRAAYALARLGLNDDAFALADKLSSLGQLDGASLLVAKAATMQRDRRFMPLMAKLGLVDYWRSSGEWPDFCSDPGLPYDCKVEAAKLAHKSAA